MRNFLLAVSAFILFHCTASAQSTFEAKFSGDYEIGDHMSNVLSDGSIVICYDLISTGPTDVDIGLIRIDSTGNMIWSKRFSGSSLVAGYFPIETSDQNIILAGHGPGNTILLTKIDFNGNVVWSKTSLYGIMPFGLPVETHDKGFAVIASNPNGSSTFDSYLLRTDSAGNFLWGKFYGAGNTGPGRLVIETADRGFLIGGGASTTHTEDVMIIKTDSVGTVEWSKLYGSFQADVSYSASQTNDGGFLISYNTFGGSTDGLHLLKLSPSGTVEWVNNYSNISGGKFSCITRQNEIIADGSGHDVLHGIYATVLIKTDSAGNLLWNKFYSTNNTAATLNIAPDNGYVLLAPNPGFDTLMVVKTDVDGNSGCEESIGLIEVSTPAIFEDTVILNVSSGGGVSNYSLTGSDVQVYTSLCNPASIKEVYDPDQLVIFPNPVDAKLNFKSDLAKNGWFAIYNMYGQQVISKRPLNESSIDVSNLRDGVYFFMLNTDEVILRKSFVVEH